MVNKMMMKAMTIVACAAGLVACTKEKGNTPDFENTDLKGRLTKDLTLEEGKTYNLVGSVQVGAPAVLTI